jgi:hypothetical protein
MDHFAQRRRPRGVNFLLGGAFAAAVVVGIGLVTGVLDLGLGVPDVRIEAEATTGARLPR